MKFILCRPAGGLNDTLCQVSKAYFYAKKYGRILIIDTECNSGIKDVFSNYFKLKDSDLVNVYYSLDDEVSWMIDKLEFYIPADLVDLIKNLDSNERRYWKYNWHRMTFDLQRSYTEDLLIHSTDGGGIDSVELLRHLKLNEALSVSINNEQIPESFHAVIVRNTDYRTDYRSVFDEIKIDLGGNKLLVVSDDIGCINYAKEFFGEDVVFTFSKPPEINNGEPLIYNKRGSQREFNELAIKQLLIAAKADKIYPTYITHPDWGLPENSMSGFVRLAIELNKNPMIIESLTNN